MSKIILSQKSFGMHYSAVNPFLFCAYHKDHYPVADGVSMAPFSSELRGRSIGSDFSTKDGWSMYHGSKVPGFPVHPHRGFETVSIIQKGLVDHHDSMGACARFGEGDVQWITTGKGIQHAEMFPLLKSKVTETDNNHMVMFQIWLNLPKRSKMATPEFTMMWSEELPIVTRTDAAGKGTKVTLIAGELDGKRAIAAPKASYASEPEADVAIWLIDLDAGATFELPAAKNARANRTLMHYDGSVAVTLGAGEKLEPSNGAEIVSSVDVTIRAGEKPARILLMQGVPINEPVAQQGPFVMNTREEVMQAYQDYHKTQFGGWPWTSDAPVHPYEKGRFAKLPTGEFIEPPKVSN